MTSPPDDLDALLSLGDVEPKQILALVPSLVRAAGGDVPPEAKKLLERLARAAGVTERDDEAAIARKIEAFVTANAPREEVKRGLFALAAGRALDLVKAGAQAAFARFSDEPAAGTNVPAPNEASSGKKGVSLLAVRSGKTSVDSDSKGD